MSRRIVERALAFARRWHLHADGLYVDLHRLHERFRPHYVDLSRDGLLGCAIVAQVGREPLADIYVDRNLTIWEQRQVYAHEIGHVVCGHPTSITALPLGHWLHTRTEREAWLAAAALLVPVAAIEPGMSEQEIASRSCVDVRLVRLLRRQHCVPLLYRQFVYTEQGT